MNKLMNCIKKVLEKKEIKQTWLANKPGKSFHIVNSNVCNYRQPSLEVRFKITKSLKYILKIQLIAKNKAYYL